MPETPHPIHLVWFKRDLRAADHRPLSEAAQRGAVLPLYICEPSVQHADDYDARHWAFTRDCLRELRERLAGLGMPLVIRIGEAVDILAGIHATHPLAAIWAHEETGNAITYARDRAVLRWAKATGIPLHETPSGGVVRRLPSRDQWAGLFTARMAEPLTPVPEALRPVAIDPGPLPTAADLALRPATYHTVQPGGMTAARETLLSFLNARGEYYHARMSSPLTADVSCSRLSPHLAYGTLSVRQVMAALRRRRADSDARRGGWPTALRAFESRVHWRDHFIQKLEDEPEIEQHSFVRAFDALRDDPHTDARAAERYAAWHAGRTGYPLVDACMRCLDATGWINFRMRAMLTAFAAYDLWLKWQGFGHTLSRRFTDYEPGIHYSQLQMQSGTSGINTLRIYNPSKQAQEHDPEGRFIRQWLPELHSVPTAYIHQPWRMPRWQQEAARCVIGQDYPAPIVEHASAVRAARAQIGALRRDPQVQQAMAAVLARHGSRRRGGGRRSRSRRPVPDDTPRQLDLGL